MDKLKVEVSPHIRSAVSTQKIMLAVLVALVPAGIAGIVIYGLRALLLMAVCVVSCVFFEWLYCKGMKKDIPVSDLSAAVTGLLLAYNLPVSMPIWEAVVGCAFAIIVVKQLFGGIGKNFANPAITARVFLLAAFASEMTNWTAPRAALLANMTDAVTSATPLGLLNEGAAEVLPSYAQLFWGVTGGSLGETCVPALLIGGIFLIAIKVIQPTIPLFYIGGVAVFSLLFGQDPLYQVMSGGLLLGAFFMATDYVTSPVTTKGKIIFALGCALLTSLIRCFGSYPEGVSFSILIMNIITPLIDRACETKPFGAIDPKEAAK